MTLMRLLLVLFLGMPLVLRAQAPSDSLFNTDQVIDVQLIFQQPSYWDSLIAYYNEGLERQLLASALLVDATGSYAFDSVGVRLKGNSSYGLPDKKSMKIDFNEYVSGQKYHGMKKLNLNNGFNDPTLLREKVFFDFCQDQGVLAPRAIFGNLTINGELIGFYGVVEQVDKEYLGRWVDDTNGNLFKAGDNFGTGGTAAADLVWYGSAQPAYETRYELKTNTTANDWSDLVDLIDVINNTTDAQVTTALPAMWDWQPLLRSLAIDNLFSNLDGYINSARNYYIYHNDTTGLWQWIKWDANESFGRYSGGVQNLTSLAPNFVANSRPLMTRIMNVPALYAQYRLEYCAVFEAFTNAQLDPHIDALVALVQSDVFADPNKQYTNAQFTSNVASNVTVSGGPGGSQTIYGLKSFINTRRQYLTGVLGCDAIGIEEGTLPICTVFPNPTEGMLRIEAPWVLRASTMELRDALGRSLPVHFATGVLDMTAFPSGTYTLMVAGATGRAVLRVMKQ